MKRAPSIYGGNDILYFLQEKGVHLPFDKKFPWHGYAMGDGRFQAVPLKWITGQAWPGWVASLPDVLRNRKRGPQGFRDYPLYIEDTKDCENHAALFQGYCTMQLACMIVNARNRAEELGQTFVDYAGVGVFEAWYTAQGSNNRRGNHAIDLILHEDRDGLAQLTPFEPKDGITFDLFKSEWESMFFIAGR